MVAALTECRDCAGGHEDALSRAYGDVRENSAAAAWIAPLQRPQG